MNHSGKQANTPRGFLTHVRWGPRLPKSGRQIWAVPLPWFPKKEQALLILSGTQSLREKVRAGHEPCSEDIWPVSLCHSSPWVLLYLEPGTQHLKHQPRAWSTSFFGWKSSGPPGAEINFSTGTHPHNISRAQGELISQWWSFLQQNPSFWYLYLKN